MSFREYRTLSAVVILLALIPSLPASGADRSARRTAGLVVVKRIDVLHGRDGVEIVITASGPINVSSKKLSNPERFVVDLQDSIPDPTFTAEKRLIPVNADDIRSVRVSPYFRPGDAVTRLVLDLARSRDLELTSLGGKVRLKLRPTELVRAEVTPARSIPAVTAPPSAPAPAVAVVPSPQLVTAAAPAGGPAPGQATSRIAAGAETTERNAGTPEQAGRLPVMTAAVAVETSAPLTVDLGTHTAPRNLMEAEFVTAPPASDLPEPNREPVAVAAAVEPPEPTIPVIKPVAPPVAVGTGVTGKHKDKTLGIDDEEAAIKASIATDKNLLIAQNGDALHTVGMRLSGTATAGYYQASTSNGYATREASPVGSGRFDASGYVHSPGFFNFSIRPQASAGRQSSEGVFPDGQGVSATTTFLAGGAAPLTVSYNRLNRKLVTFGPLDRLAGLEANTYQDSFGANWRLTLRHLPEIGLNYSKYSDSYEPLAALASKTANRGRLLSGDISQKVLGWNLQTRYKLERSSQDLINIFDPAQEPYLYTRKDQDVRASADRELGRWGSASFVAGQTKSQNEVQGRPFDQGFRFLSGGSFLRPSKKLTLGFRGGITDNVVGASLDRTLGSSGLAPDQPLILVPSKAKLEMVSYSGSAQYAIRNDLRVHTDVLRETTRAPLGSSLATSTSDLMSLQAGLAFNHRFRWWQLQSSYAANGGRFTYAATGASRSLGHRANVALTIGSLESLELTAAVHGSLQNVTGNTYVYDRSAGASVVLSRAFSEHWKIRASYDRERDQYRFSGTQLSSLGNAASLAIVHSRMELSASHNIRDGLTFQADPRLQFVSSGQSALLLGAFAGTSIVPSAATWSSAALAIHPVPKFTGRVSWMRSRQQLQGAFSNAYTDWEASAGYQFRSITVDAGYLLHDQNFAVDMFKRNRFFFRIVREFTVF